MIDIFRGIFPFAFAVVWSGVGIVLYFRTRVQQAAYLKRFPPVNGVPLYMVNGGNPFGARAQAIRHTMRSQSDPDLERLRREVWCRFRLCLIWIFGFPLLSFGIAALLIISGLAY
jgi:hypothetical protein